MKFIKHYIMIYTPLKAVLKKGVPFIRIPSAHQAFELLKQSLMQAPVLALPDVNKLFTLGTDASDFWSCSHARQSPHCISP
jgi:hypothetical protein